MPIPLILILTALSPSGGGTVLAWKPKVGDVHHYRVEMKITLPATADEQGDVDITARLKDTIRGINRDGTVVEQEDWSKLAATFKGEPMDADKKPDFSVFTLKAPNGNLLGVAAPYTDSRETDSPDQGPLTSVPLVFPSGPVKVGESWTAGNEDSKQPKDPAAKEASEDPDSVDVIAATYTFSGTDMLKDQPCYLIKLDGKCDKHPEAQIFGNLWIAQSDGHLMKTEVHMKGLKSGSDGKEPEPDMEILVEDDD